MGAGDVVDGQVAQYGKHILGEDASDLFGRALAPLIFQREAAVGQPFVVDGLEGVLARQDDGVALALALRMRVDALGQHGPGLVAQIASVFQGKRGIATEGHALALAAPSEAEVPGLEAGGGDVEVETVEIDKRIRLAGHLGLSNLEV